jgi:hypothetical protein
MAQSEEHFTPSDLVQIYGLQEYGWGAHDLGNFLKTGLLRGHRNKKGVTYIHEESLISLLKFRNITLEKQKFELPQVLKVNFR